MAAANAPITMTEALTLPSVGINPQFITFTHVTMESDKYICIRETAPQNSLVIIDMSMPMQPLRRPITADSALMNPNSRILALKAQLPGTTQDHLQIFNIEMKAKMKSYQMPEQIVFWKWITPKMLGLVTQTTVYHWSIEGDLEPVKMFERTANLVNNQILNYRCDPTEKWLALIGVAPGSSEWPLLVKGNMQLFSVDQQQSQALEAHAASFASFKVAGNENPSTLICFASKTTNAGQITSKLHAIELGAQPGKPAFTKKQADLLFPPAFADDFPVAMQICHKYSLVYVITKLGLLFVYDLETATAVYRNRISPDPIFLTTEASSVGGFYAVNRRGQVLLATVNEATIVPFVSGQLNNLELAVNLAKRGNLPGAENLVIQQFQELFAQTKYKEAAKVAAESPQGILLTLNTANKFESVPVQTGQTPPLLQYFGTLLTRGKLKAFESLILSHELSLLVVNQNKKNLLENWLAEDKLECSEELGDLMKTVDNDLALKIYIKARATPKVVAAFAERREIDKILIYSKLVGYTPDDYLFLLQTILQTDPQGAVNFSLMMCQMEGGCPVDYNTIKDLFLQRNLIREARALDVLKRNLPKHAFLQTKEMIDETMALVENMTVETMNFLDIFNQSPVEEEPRAVEPKTTLAKLARVPKVLRDDESIKECFEPKFVSIGPYHHGNPKLQKAEDLKKEQTIKFVKACGCSSEILYGKLYKEINQIRNFYENELVVKYNDEALTQILFVDGCFLLHFIYSLLQTRALEDFNLEKNNFGSVLWDSILLENQLPFLVLKLLGENNFEYLPLIVGYIEFICNNFLPIKVGWKMYNLQPGNSSHLVQLLQMGLQGLYEVKRDVKYLLSPPPNYSVTELKKVGIRCKPSRRGSFKCTRFSPYRFHGVLELPSMTVGLFTRRYLLNLIAYEMHPDVQRLEIQSYIIFLASLVRQPQDVKALREARVLYNYIGSDEEVVELFKEISSKSSPEKMLGYDGIQMEIGRYIDKKGRIKVATWLAEVFSDYCRSPWTAVGVLVVFLSVSAAMIQLVLKIVSYKNKKVE